MSRKVSNEDLMRYLDAELDPEERSRVESAVRDSTELQRELSLYRAIRDDVADLTFSPQPNGSSVWDSVNRKLTRPVGWILLVSGAVVFFVYSAVVYAVSDQNIWEKIGVGGLVIGFLILLASTVYERAREWQTDPYRDVQR